MKSVELSKLIWKERQYSFII